MKLLLSTETGIIHWAIRVSAFSQWSHVAVIDGDNVIESVSFAGVREIPLQQALQTASKYTTIEIPIPNEAAFLEAVRSQIGKPYDYTAIAGLLVHRDWQAEDRWFCSELPAWAANKAGCPIFRAEAMHRVTPEHWWMLTPKGE